MLRNDNPTGSLACLSVRFKLEFNLDDTTRDVIRLCTIAIADL